MRSVQYRIVVCWLLLGCLGMTGVSHAVTPTAEQLQRMQQLSDDDLGRLEQVIKDRQQITNAADPAMEASLQPVVLPRDPYAGDSEAADVGLKPFV